MYNEESNLCLLASTHEALSAFIFNFDRKKSAFCFRLLLLYSAICLNTPYNISTCGFLKFWPVELKNNRLNFYLFIYFWNALNKWNRTIDRRKINIITMLICILLSICDIRKIIKQCWKILFLSSLIHNFTVMFFKGSANKGVSFFLFRRLKQHWSFFGIKSIWQKQLSFISPQNNKRNFIS